LIKPLSRRCTFVVEIKTRPGRSLLNTSTAEASTSGRASDTPQPSDFPRGTLLDNRYEVDSVLGRGGNGVTYRCLDKDTGHLVAIKSLSLRSLRDWKQLDLFQREAQILENLSHPGIPKYIDSFEEDTAADRSFFLVQELAAGASLEAMVNRGWRADEKEVARIAKELLIILQYLGSRRPAVVHRDVKPSNIVIEGGKTGGRVFLVDFGGVQAAAAAGDIPGSTVIGTYGFMAPEQFRGAAQPASDLYGLGATLLFMLSGRPPSAFPVDRMRLDLSSVAMGPVLEDMVEGLLEPVLEDRLSAEEALNILTGITNSGVQKASRNGSRNGGGGNGSARKRSDGAVGGSVFGSNSSYNNTAPSYLQQGSRESPSFVDPRRFSGTTGMTLRKPPGSRIEVTKKGPRLEIKIPPARFDGDTAANGAFAIAWNAFVAFWTGGAFAAGGIFFALFSIPFWFTGVSLLKESFGRHFLREKIEIGLGKWTLQQWLAGFTIVGELDWSNGGGKEAGGRTADLIGASMRITGYINDVPQGQLVLRQGVETYVFGEGLDVIEQEWLTEVINAHLYEVSATRGEIEAFAEDDDTDEESFEEHCSEQEERIKYSEFAEFDRKLGVEAAAAAEKAEKAGKQAARDAEKAGNEATAAGRRAADEAQRKAKRAAAQAQRQVADPTGTIELDSGEFDIYDD
jgi:eukaryotic-like serine/threonine-protein kinase